MITDSVTDLLSFVSNIRLDVSILLIIFNFQGSPSLQYHHHLQDLEVHSRHSRASTFEQTERNNISAKHLFSFAVKVHGILCSLLPYLYTC